MASLAGASGRGASPSIDARPAEHRPEHRRTARAALIGAAMLSAVLTAWPAVAQPQDQPPAKTLTAPRAQGIVAADFDGDGRDDLAVAVTAGVLVFANTPDDRGRPFGSAPLLINAARQGTGLGAGDLDGDGAIDLVVARPGAPSLVLFATASDRFEPVPLDGSNGARAVALADVDGDSLVDVALTGDDDTVVFRNLGARRFAAPETAAGGEALAIVAADFTGEGRAELVISRRRSDVEVYRRAGTGYELALALPTGPSSSLAIGDLNADQVPDLAVGSRSASGAVLLARPGGSLSFASAAHRQASATQGVLLADFDRDGRTDLATVGADGVHRIFLNDGAAPPAFVLGPHRFNGARNAASAATGFFDMDDVPDVAIAAGNRVEIFVNVGRPVPFGVPRLILNGEAAMTLTVGDTYVDPGATAFDDVDGNLTSKIVVDNPVDPKTIGSYVVTYAVVNSAGNRTTATRTVNVQARAAAGGGGGGAFGLGALALLSLLLASRLPRGAWLAVPSRPLRLHSSFSCPGPEFRSTDRA